MFHQLQAELRGDAPAHVWLTEGSAKLSEFVLLEWLNKGSTASHRFNLVNQLVNVKLLAAPSDLIDGGLKWTGLVEQKMYPYQVSELMTDYLMRQAGRQSIVSYFRYLGATRNRDAAFQKAFGVSYGQFISDYRAYFAREAETKGRIIFESEDGVSPEIASALQSSASAVEKVLRKQGWPLISSQRFILAPDKEATLKVLRREQSQANDDKLVEVVNKGTIVGIGGLSYVVNTAKLTDVDRGLYPLAMTIARGEVMLAARPAQGNSIYWLYEGTVRLLAAQAAEAAGHKSVADAQRGWVDVIKATADAPDLSEMKGSFSPAMGRYGEEKVMATVSLVVARLAEKASPNALLRYFAVLRDLNDAPRAFQQVFGLSPEAYSEDFAAYVKTLRGG